MQQIEENEVQLIGDFVPSEQEPKIQYFENNAGRDEFFSHHLRADDPHFNSHFEVSSNLPTSSVHYEMGFSPEARRRDIGINQENSFMSERDSSNKENISFKSEFSRMQR